VMMVMVLGGLLGQDAFEAWFEEKWTSGGHGA